LMGFALLTPPKKMKTHKGLKKRLKVTGTGKVLYRRSGRRHLMAHKSGKRSRHLRQERALSKGDRKAIQSQFGAL